MSPQESIAHYRIVSKLGEGGMGAVYRATDTKLHRAVAIKVLPPGVAEDAGRMARFEREAQVLASLNHPNIAAIYGIEKGALVMELVEGADLKGPVPADTVMDYARQIVAGLEAAHEKGIVHRDLKPANIKVTPEGQIKLLDFGLAKNTEPAAAAAGGSNTMSATVAMGMTEVGMILGTAAYMSPEQARGKPVDQRADIWAFGVILFELLSGSQLYGGGETVTDTLAAVVKDAPDLTKLPADTPAPLRRLIGACLRKDPNQRLRHIGDARLLLEESESSVPQPAAALPAAPPARQAWPLWLAGVAVAIAVLTAGIAWLRWPAAAPSAEIMRFQVPLPAGTKLPPSAGATQWVPSPDGRNLAMVVDDGTDTSLWVRPLDAAAAHRLDNTEGANFPFWSPDGQSIGFFTADKLKRVALAGGALQTICELPTANSRSAADGGTWAADGTIVFGPVEKPLMRVPAAGGVAPAPVTVLEKDERDHVWPQFLPDGKHLLYLARQSSSANNEIYLHDLASGKRVPVLRNSERVAWSAPGYLLFTHQGSLFAQRLDAQKGQLQGTPVPVADNIVSNAANGRSTFAVSQNGMLVYRLALDVANRQLSWRDRSGKVLSLVGKPTRSFNMWLSPDEKSAALIVGSGGVLDIWLMDVATGAMTPMTRDGKQGRGGQLAWSPDSKRLAMVVATGGIREIAVSSGASTVLTTESLLPETWLPNDSALLSVSGMQNALSLVPRAEGGRPQSIVTTPYRQSDFRLSPDGKYAAYVSDEAGGPAVYVAAFPAFAIKRRVSVGSGLYPLWTNGGKEILYRTGDGSVMAASIRTGTGIEIGDQRTLFKGALPARFGASADGQRLLLNEALPQDVPERPELTLMVNWQAKIKP